MPTMITFRAGRVVLGAVFLALTACSAEQQDWRAAEGAGTIEAYGRFIEQHPGSELASQARTRVAELTEQSDWQQAGKVGTVEAYRQFLAQHPGGRWAQEARIRIESFALGSLPRIDGQRQDVPGSRASGVKLLQLASAAPVAPASATAVPGESAVAAEPASAPVAPDVSSGGYAVQLGAFGSTAGADREWQRLQTRFGAQLSGLSPRVVAASTGAGELYRLQASAAGEAQARAVCDSLRAQSQACVPVLPH
jgi:cell division septation protein DedD